MPQGGAAVPELRGFGIACARRTWPACYPAPLPPLLTSALMALNSSMRSEKAVISVGHTKVKSRG